METTAFNPPVLFSGDDIGLLSILIFPHDLHIPVQIIHNCFYNRTQSLKKLKNAGVLLLILNKNYWHEYCVIFSNNQDLQNYWAGKYSKSGLIQIRKNLRVI